jgi:hypothetical protein
VTVVVVEVAAPVPRLTTPLRVALPGVAVVCARAGTVIRIQNGAT